MKQYQRTEWYGFGYVFQWYGSILPRCVPITVVAVVFNWLVHKRHIPLWEDKMAAHDALAHPYTFQVVGLMFASFTIYRINISYNRYWEGVTMVKNMHSKWADACGQVISFDRSRSSQCDLTSDPFCCHVVRLFSQMSAMATMRLHVVEPGESMLFENMEPVSAAQGRLKPLEKARTSTRIGGAANEKKPACRVSKIAPAGVCQTKSPHEHAPAGDSLAAPAGDSLAALAKEEKAREALGSVAEVANLHKSDGHLKRGKSKSKHEKMQELAAGISPAERRLLQAAPCPVFATAQRIQRAIITRHHAGGMVAPPPIVSRIVQEISNGTTAHIAAQTNCTDKLYCLSLILRVRTLLV